MKILITGGQGQIGRDLGQVLQPGHEVISLSKAQLDFSFPERIEGALQACRPDYLVNVAAFTNVDACETERNLAWKVNGEGAGWLAKACRERRIPLLHLSTDYVFDGRKAPTEAYVEEDPTDPLSFYGQSKLEGEREVQGSGGKFLILRTAWVYGIGGVNFLKTILRRVLQKQALQIVNDQFGSPTWSHRIARQIRRLIEAEAYGLYHAAAEGYATWFEVAKTFFGLMEISAELSPCSSSEYPTVAQRPKNSRLENRRLKCEGLSEMKDWREDLTEFVGRFKEESPNAIALFVRTSLMVRRWRKFFLSARSTPSAISPPSRMSTGPLRRRTPSFKRISSGPHACWNWRGGIETRLSAFIM